MSTTVVVLPQPAAAVPEDPVYRLTVSQYHDMLRNGTLGSGEPVELLEGWLIQTMSKNPPHRIANRKARIALERVVPAGWYVDAQEPITTADSEPEPDLAVIRGETTDYPDRHPGPADLALLVEISDSTLARDRGLKRRVYARASVPIYWIVVLSERAVEVYADPSGRTADPAYGPPRRYADGESVPVVIDGVEVGTVAVADLLP